MIKREKRRSEKWLSRGKRKEATGEEKKGRKRRRKRNLKSESWTAATQGDGWKSQRKEGKNKED